MLKKFLPRGLLGRSLLIIVVPLIILQVVSAVVFYDRHWANVSTHRSNSLAGDVAMFINLLETMRSEEETRWLINLARTTLDIRLTILPGANLADQGPYRPRGTLERTLANSLRQIVDRPFFIDTQVDPKRFIILVQLPGRVLQVDADDERLFSSTTSIFILWMIGTSLVLAVVATMFMRNQVSPIKRLARAADNFGKGRDAPDFRPSGATEVRQAASAFLAMRDRIKRQIQQRTEMLAGVSHDLRTPLTRMKLQLAMFKKNREIDDLSADVAEMERMVNGYLDFARGEGSEAPKRTDIIPVLQAVVHDARRAGAAIDLSAQGPLELPLRQDAFRRCMTNLISNAARYGQSIIIAAERNGATLQITVDDDGPGIPAGKREEAFRPFLRLDESRSPDTSGTGLGLSIARDIVHGHGGEISLAQSPMGGLRAIVNLPL